MRCNSCGAFSASLRKGFWAFRCFSLPIPSGGGGIIFGMLTAFPKVLLHILFSDGIAPCLFPGILAGHGSALQQVACCGFTDPAKPIEPVFIDDIWNLIPVDPFIHFLTPQGKYFGCKCCPLVLWIAAQGAYPHFLSFFSPKVELRLCQVSLSGFKSESFSRLSKY